MKAICGNYPCNRQQGSAGCPSADWCPYYIANTPTITSDSTSPLPKKDWACVKTAELQQGDAMEMSYKYIQQGWQCPVCGKVHAPWVSACDCHETIVKATTTTETPYPDYTQKESITVGFAGERSIEILAAERKDDGK